jgi:DNA (cytosine-5)-methyltransferase 1
VADNSTNVVSLCSGAAGLELGLKLAVPGARTVCYVERDAFACSILAGRMRDGVLDEAPIWTDLKTFRGAEWRGAVDIVTAGWPCQPFSTMGKGLGEKDERHLWPFVRDIVRDINPICLFGENVANHLKVGFDKVQDDLRGMGYSHEAGIFAAAEVGGTHIRNRLFVLAYPSSEHARLRELEPLWGKTVGGRDGGLGSPTPASEREGFDRAYPPTRERSELWGRITENDPLLEPAFFTRPDAMAAGVGESCQADRNKQVRAMGNGVVPPCAAYAFMVLLGRALGRIPRPVKEEAAKDQVENESEVVFKL